MIAISIFCKQFIFNKGIDVKRNNMQEKLEGFINKLEGEVISVVPNVKPIFMPFGGTARVDFLLITEKIR